MRGLFTAAVAVAILWPLPSMVLTQSEDSSAFRAGNGEGAGLSGGFVFNPRSSSPFKIHNNLNEIEFCLANTCRLRAQDNPFLFRSSNTSNLLSKPRRQGLAAAVSNRQKSTLKRAY